MCPFCFATLALVAVSATSAGGVAAMAVKLSRRKMTDSASNPKEGTNENANRTGKA